MSGTNLPRRAAGWLRTGTCVAILVAAQLLVALVPMRFWGHTLGKADGGKRTESPAFHGNPSRHGVAIARRIDRAAERLPWHVRCLPRAMAGQWLMRLAGLESTLVIARKRIGERDKHALHAWIEQEGAMLIGACEREAYVPIARWRCAAGTSRVPRLVADRRA